MASPYVVDTTDSSFELDVIEASRTQLVVVDFWAAWCQPCRLLAPILEQAIEKMDGRVRLAKANTDEAPGAANQYGVQGIPAVFAFANGEVVDQFSGVLPEAALQEWLARNLDRFDIQDALAKIESDPDSAKQQLLRLKEVRELHPEATLGLAKLYFQANESESASAEIAELERRGFLEPEAEAIKTKLELASHESIDIGSLQEAVAQNPDDFAARIELAEAKAVHGELNQALELLLEVVQQNQGDFREAAREKMVSLFRIVEDEELVREFRKRLSMALY